MAQSSTLVPGLAGIPCAKSAIGFIDGSVGKLQYRGYPIEVLAEECAFEEVVFLLQRGELPSATELEEFRAEMIREREVSFRALDVFERLPERTHPMTALTIGVSTLGGYHEGDHVEDLELRRGIALRLVAKVPTLVAAWHRIRQGKRPVSPRADLGHAENFLYMLEGERPDPMAAHVAEVALVLHAEHSMNASTFAARVTGSTLADPYAVVSSAIGALSGRLHGGANERVLAMLRTIPDRSPEGVRRWAEDRLARRDKIMGFGHRVYKVKDPRANILQGLASGLFAKLGRTPIYDLAVELEGQMEKLVGHKGIYPNVDFYSGIVYEKLGIPVDLFTPVFAVSRVSGWLAHLLEQLEDNRIFRPSQVWVGESDRAFVALADR
ncbi:MAG: citrate synthase [Deltaproteobacteria bacterium]|nr:citrate synthase [Deltaproteobacteria bacterium]